MALALPVRDRAPDVVRFEPRSSGLSPSMTLTSFWNSFALPVVFLAARRSDPKTVRELDTSLKYWVQFTDDPSINAIDDRVAAAYFAGLYSLPGRRRRLGQRVPISEHTIDKHVTNIQGLLHLCGPYTREFPSAQELITRVPVIPKPKFEADALDDEEDVRTFTLDEITKILRGATEMGRPLLRDVSPATYWRSLVTLAYNSGERRHALLHVRFENLLPDGRLWFPRSIRKRKRKGIKIHLNQAARAAIDAMRGSLAPDDAIFRWDTSERNFDLQWQRLLHLSGIATERCFGIHALRKTCATAVAGMDPLAAQWLLGHSDFRVTNDHYLAGKGARVGAALEKLPQPDYQDPRQRKLF